MESSVIRGLGEELVCPVCQDEFDNPKFLSCHHYYCKTCIERLAAVSGQNGAPFPCPECRAETLLPEGGADRLTPAFVVNRFKERVEKGKQQVFTKNDEPVATIPPSTSSSKQTAVTSGYVCKKHDSVLKLFCFDCQQLICAECALSPRDHREHNYSYVKDSARDCREAISRDLAGLVAIRKRNESAVAQVEQRKGEVIDQSLSVQRDVNKSFDDIISVIEQRRRLLLRQVEELTESKTTSLSAQKKALELANENIDQVTAMVNTALDMPDEEFMNSQNQLLWLVKKEASAHNNSTSEPLDTADIVAEITCIGDIYDACQMGTRVYVPLVSGAGILSPEINKRASFTIRPAASVVGNGSAAAVTATLVCVASRASVPVSVDAGNGANTYAASYVAKVRGRYALTVNIDRKPSNYSIFVRAPPTPAAKLFTTCTGLRGPAHVDFTSSGQVVVSERIGNRVALRYQNQCSPLEQNFVQPYGVTVDQYDNVYVSESKGRRLSKFDKKGQLIASMGGRDHTDGDLFAAPAGTRIVRNKLYVCDTERNIIHVFDHNLNLLDSIHTSDLGTGPKDITSSPAGYLYVTVTKPPCVLVFGMEHTHMHSIKHKDMQCPTGVCYDVHQQLLYVCDSTANCIFMFRHNGDCVMKMSVEGGPSNQMRGPVGITSDKDGYIYVCDTGNNRVIVL